MYLQLYQVKKHLYINDDFHDDDEYLVDLIQVTENIVQKHIDRELAELEDEEGNIPSPLTRAMLLLIGTYYASRESVAYVSTSELPHGYDYIIALYKNYDGSHEGTSTL